MDPFERGMMMRGTHPSQQANKLQQTEAADKKAEAARAFSTEAQSLRKLMSIYQPERKDEFTTMGLGDLRGESMAYAGKAAEAKARQETLKAQRDEQSAKALEALLKQAGQTTPMSVPSSVMPGVFPDRTVGTRSPLTASRVRELLPDHPDAANSGNLVDLMRVLQAGDDESGGGGIEFVTDPAGAVIARSRKTDQFQYSPASRADAEAGRTRFTVEPIMDKFGQPAAYGVKAQFGNEKEAQAWAEQQNKALGGGASVPASQFKSADDVKAAVKSGKLKKDEAVKILQTQFGYK